MIRRDMITKTSLMATVPFFWGNSFIETGLGNTQIIQPSTIKKFGDGRDWFFKHRYGMFVHWGIYSIPAWHEQHQWRARVPREEYVKLANQWNPAKFNPERWLDLMEEAGMKYLTITTKHHDGFCLWDTRQSSFNTMNTPYKKDIIGMLADACHKRNVPLCLYYSIVDWNHPNYPNSGRHHELSAPEKGDNPDWNKYMEFLKAQVRELCTNYGEIHGFWWDMNVPEYKDPSINAMIRQLQPNAVINNRGFDEGDFGTPERDYDGGIASAKEFYHPTEACQSVGMESWGYKRDEDYYSDWHLISSLDRYLSRGSNYLLNVGPTADGIIPFQSTSILKRIGKWKKTTQEAFDETNPAFGLVDNPNIDVTQRENTLFIHLNKVPEGNGINLKPIQVKPFKATLLNNGQAVDCTVNLTPSDHETHQEYLRIRNLPVNKIANSVMVVKLEFDRSLSEITKKEEE